ncbi:glycosyltransferase [Fulvimarina sp. MAC3]|uniref:glycosyltransferase n=1 Tax=Fulvimarina sp. MAC3 TaxID=3148887 RepID=UPI0031FC0659
MLSNSASDPFVMRSEVAATRDLQPVVAVPAKDEEERIPRLIRALSSQTWLAAEDRSLDIVIVLNNTADRSRNAIEDAALGTRLRVHLVDLKLPAAFAHVGTARRFALDLARTLCRTSMSSVLLTTDADAVPSARWIDANLLAISAGADIVGGRIVGDRREEALLGQAFLARAASHLIYADLCDRVMSLLDPVEHDPWPRHRDHTGASLAVRADVFDAVGGLPALPYREDLAFVSRVRDAGYRLRHSPSVRVEVSARTKGRAPGGMADTIAAWVADAQTGRPCLVEDPESVVERALRRSMLRQMNQASASLAVQCAARCGLELDDFCDAAGDFLAPEILVQRFAPDEPDARATVDIETAITELRAIIADQERTVDAA